MKYHDINCKYNDHYTNVNCLIHSKTAISLPTNHLLLFIFNTTSWIGTGQLFEGCRPKKFFVVRQKVSNAAGDIVIKKWSAGSNSGRRSGGALCLPQLLRLFTLGNHLTTSLSYRGSRRKFRNPVEVFLIRCVDTLVVFVGFLYMHVKKMKYMREQHVINRSQ